MGRKKEQAVVDVVINNEQARRKVKELSAEFDDLRKRKREALKAGDTGKANALDKELKVLQKEMNQYKKSVVDVDHVLRNLNKVPLNQLEAAQRNLRKNLRLLDQDSREYKATLEKLNRVQRQIDSTQKQMQVSGKGFLGGLGNMMPLGIMGIIYALKQLTVPFTRFQYMMAKVGAVSNATASQFKELKENAKELGASTEYTATEVADLQLNYARLGFVPGQILKITSATLDLATATGSDLATSADVAGSTLKAFNYDASQMPRVVDVMANSFNKSALRLDYFSESMKYVAPIAAKANVSLEQTTAMLGILADRGIRGSQAGTALKRILSEISLEGKTVSEALADLNEKGLTLADAEDEVGKYAMTALTVLADNAPAVENLNAVLEDSAGAAKRAADMMRDTIQGDVDTFKSKLEGLTIELGDKLNPIIRGTIQLFTWLLTPLSVVAVALASWFVTLKVGTAAVTAYNAAKKAFRVGVSSSTQALISETAAMNVNTIAAKRNLIAIRNMPAATKAWAAAKLLLAGNLRAAAVAARMFIASIGPIGWIAIAVGAIVGAVAAFSGESKKASDASSQLALELSQERSTYESLKKVVLESAEGSKARAEAIRQINERYKDYLPNLLSEKTSNEEVATALDYVTQKMEENIKTRIRAEEMQRLQKEQFEAEKEALDFLIGRYQALSGDTKTPEQIALVTQQFADQIVQLRATGDYMGFLQGVAKVLGLSVEDTGKLVAASADIAEKGFGRIVNESFIWANAINVAFEKVTGAANNFASSIIGINALMGSGITANSKYVAMDLDQLRGALNNVNRDLEQNSLLSADGRKQLELDRDEIQKQIKARELQSKVDSSYAGVLQRLKDEKKDLEVQLNNTDGANKKEIDRIQALIAAKQKEIDLYENKKTPGSSGSKWSLTSDETYLKAKAELRERQMKGDIASEEEYSRLLLALEIKTLEDRIAANKEKGADFAKLKSELAEKQYQQTKNEQARTEKLLATARTPYESEVADYEKRLKELGLFGIDREQMTEDQQRALLKLENEHRDKLYNLWLNGLSKQEAKRKENNAAELRELRTKQNNELAAATTLEQKKAILRRWFSDADLQRVTSNEQAQKIITAKYQDEEQQMLKKHLEDTIATYNLLLSGAINPLFALGLTPEMRAKMQAELDKLQEELSKVNLNISQGDTTADTDKTKGKSNIDILGFSEDQWEDFFKKSESVSDSIGKWNMALQAVGNTFGMISDMMTAAENREFKKYEQTANRKKKTLDQQLKAGTISQERYNSAVQQIDEETEAKREEMERKQAKRQKIMSLFQALTNTAVAITAALPNIPLVAVVSALGAIQAATILATPLPGFEEGGLIGVEREQDGKRYRAAYDPNRRGPVTRPTVLVGENGTEYVVPAEGYENPTIRPVLDIMERARRSGTIREINLPAALAASGVIPGRAAGGYVGGAAPAPESTASSAANAVTGYDDGVMRELKEVVGKLSRQLEKPIPTYISYLGRDGIATIQKKLEQQQRRAGIGGK